MHYDRWIRSGRVGVGPSAPLKRRAKGEVCTVDDCANAVRCKGVCESHYKVMLKGACPQCGNPKTAKAERCWDCHWDARRTIPTSKACTKCETEKPIDEFGWRVKENGHTAPYSWCKACEKDYRAKRAEALRSDPVAWEASKARRRAQKGSGDPERRFWAAVRSSARMLGLDVEDVVVHIQRVGHLCEVCGHSPEPGERRLALDHDHATGRFRGLLCSRCNFAIGMLRDDPERCRAAADYLERAVPTAGVLAAV